MIQKAYYIQDKAKYFGGKDHGQLCNVSMEKALLRKNAIALQEIFHLNGEKVKFIYIAIVKEKEKYYQEIINDFEALLKDVDGKKIFEVAKRA